LLVNVLFSSRISSKKYERHSDSISCIKISKNDAQVASSSLDGSIFLHSLTTGKKLASLVNNTAQPIKKIVYAPFEKKNILANCGDGGVIAIFDCEKGEEVFNLQVHESPSSDLCFFPNSFNLVSAGLDKRCVLMDVNSKRLFIYCYLFFLIRSRTKDICTSLPLTSVDLSDDGVNLVLGCINGRF